VYVARQWLSKNVTAATNAQITIAELLDASFSIWFVSYHRNVGNHFFPELLVIHCKQNYIRELSAEINDRLRISIKESFSLQADSRE
jgi:hypothetical protein